MTRLAAYKRPGRAKGSPAIAASQQANRVIALRYDRGLFLLALADLVGFLKPLDIAHVAAALGARPLAHLEEEAAAIEGAAYGGMPAMNGAAAFAQIKAIAIGLVCQRLGGKACHRADDIDGLVELGDIALLGL